MKNTVIEHVLNVPGKITIKFHIEAEGDAFEVENFRKNYMMTLKLTEKVIAEHPELL